MKKTEEETTDSKKQSQPSVVTQPLLQFALASLFCFTSSSVTLSFNYAHGASSFRATLAVFLAEFLKFFFSFGLRGFELMQESKSNPAHHGGLFDSSSLLSRPLKVLESTVFFLYGLPALIYAIQNNLAVYSPAYVNAPTFQLLSQLKLYFTTLLVFFAFKRKITILQGIALIVLIQGIYFTDLPQKCDVAGDGSGQIVLTFAGVLISSVIAFLSAFGGVTSEYLLKSEAQESIHYQNSCLYFWGLVINIFLLLPSLQDLSLEELADPYLWLVACILALHGFSASLVLKRVSALAKVLAGTISLCVVAGVSVPLFGVPLELEEGVGILLAVQAIFIFNYEKLFINTPPTTTKS